MKKIVIAGFAGIGKTTLEKINSKDVIDMEIRQYKYSNYNSEYTLQQWYSMEHILNENFLQKYFKAVKDEIQNGTHKIIFVWCTIEVIQFLSKENIEYLVATWDNEEENIRSYLNELYTKRGNPIDWREKVIRYLDVINDYTKSEKLPTIILHKNENMELKLKEMKLL